jgi:UDP-N-acetylglucosamine diphosphorylase/glucosamine-1-phosphate N-acetyltransferase
MTSEKKIINALCVFEDEAYPNFFPLTLSQPTFELRIGGLDFRSRLQIEVKAAKTSVLCRDYLAPILALKEPELLVNELPPGDVLFLNGRLLCYGSDLEELIGGVPENCIAVKGAHVVAARLSEPVAADFAQSLRSVFSDEAIARVCETMKAFTSEAKQPAAKAKKVSKSDDADNDVETGTESRGEKLPAEILELIGKHGLTRTDASEAKLISFPWQVIEENPAVIDDDFQKSPFRGQSEDSIVYPGTQMVGEENIVIGQAAVIKPGAVLDASSGPIIISDGANVMANSSIVGPVYIGVNSIVKTGAKILEGTSIGDVCKVGGEVDQTIFAAYANKQHDGFIGHSYIGEWVNIGAGTNNSDLKNNYSAVRTWNAGVIRDTGRQFLGLIVGAHTKTGIGTLFNSGTVVGFNCNVFGSELFVRFVPSFSWGTVRDLTTYDLEKAVLTAQVVMERRDVKFDDAYRQYFEKIFELSVRCARNI